MHTQTQTHAQAQVNISGMQLVVPAMTVTAVVVNLDICLVHPIQSVESIMHLPYFKNFEFKFKHLFHFTD